MASNLPILRVNHFTVLEEWLVLSIFLRKVSIFMILKMCLMATYGLRYIFQKLQVHGVMLTYIRHLDIMKISTKSILCYTFSTVVVKMNAVGPFKEKPISFWII